MGKKAPTGANRSWWEKGLEPPRRKAPDPKSGESADSATPAYRLKIIMHALLYMSLKRAHEKRRRNLVLFPEVTEYGYP